MRRYYLLLFLLFLLILAACSSDPRTAQGRTVIRIAYLPITHSAAVMILPDVTRYDENYYIQLERFTSWPEVSEALRAGHVDGASMLFEVALTIHERDNSFRALGLSHRDGNVIVVGNYIEEFQDLIGRNVAIPHVLSPHYILLRTVLERENIDRSDLNIRDLSPAEMPFTMAARAISAYVVAEPWGSLAEARGIGHILETSNEVFPQSICCILLFNENIFIQNEGLYEWFTEQFLIAAAYAQARDEKVFNAFQQATSFERDIIEQSLSNTNFIDLELTEQDYVNVTEHILRFGIHERVPHFHNFVLGGCC